MTITLKMSATPVEASLRTLRSLLAPPPTRALPSRACRQSYRLRNKACICSNPIYSTFRSFSTTHGQRESSPSSSPLKSLYIPNPSGTGSNPRSPLSDLYSAAKDTRKPQNAARAFPETSATDVERKLQDVVQRRTSRSNIPVNDMTRPWRNKNSNSTATAMTGATGSGPALWPESSSSVGMSSLLSQMGPARPMLEKPPKAKVPPIRLNPFLGRSVEVNPDRGVDLVRGLNLLRRRLTQNNVKTDASRQRFHERAGLKRKRLKSLRWRRRFKAGFQAILGQVRLMRSQGW